MRNLFRSKSENEISSQTYLHSYIAGDLMGSISAGYYLKHNQTVQFDDFKEIMVEKEIIDCLKEDIVFLNTIPFIEKRTISKWVHSSLCKEQVVFVSFGGITSSGKHLTLSALVTVSDFELTKYEWKRAEEQLIQSYNELHSEDQLSDLIVFNITPLFSLNKSKKGKELCNVGYCYKSGSRTLYKSELIEIPRDSYSFDMETLNRVVKESSNETLSELTILTCKPLKSKRTFLDKKKALLKEGTPYYVTYSFDETEEIQYITNSVSYVYDSVTSIHGVEVMKEDILKDLNRNNRRQHKQLITIDDVHLLSWVPMR